METNIRFPFSWVVFANPKQNCKKKIMLEKNALMPCWCHQPLSCLFGAIDWLVIVLVTSFIDWTTPNSRGSHLSFPHCLFFGKKLRSKRLHRDGECKEHSPSTNRYSPFPGNKPWLSLTRFLLTLFTRISELKSIEVNKHVTLNLQNYIIKPRHQPSSENLWNDSTWSWSTATQVLEARRVLSSTSKRDEGPKSWAMNRLVTCWRLLRLTGLELLGIVSKLQNPQTKSQNHLICINKNICKIKIKWFTLTSSIDLHLRRHFLYRAMERRAQTLPSELSFQCVLAAEMALL